VWTESTSDTTLAPRAAAKLSRGGSYFWYVDALGPDGRSATTGVQRIQISP
jgi:hypothetical protein